MALDIERLKKKLARMKGESTASPLLLKLEEGVTRVRIVPRAADPGDPFIEAYFHYPNGRTVISPISYGDRDPIAEFGEELKPAGMAPKELWNTIKHYFPQKRTFVQVVVVGKEEEGIKFWGFGKGNATKLVGALTDPEWGDITDPMAGRDLKLTMIPAKKNGTQYSSTDFDIVPNQTKLAGENKELRKKLLTEQPEFEKVYDRPTQDELMKILEKYAGATASKAGMDDDDGEPTPTPKKASWDEEPKSEDEGTPKSTPTPKAKAKSKSTKVAEEFDEIFADDDKDKEEDDKEAEKE